MDKKYEELLEAEKKLHQKKSKLQKNVEDCLRNELETWKTKLKLQQEQQQKERDEAEKLYWQQRTALEKDNTELKKKLAKLEADRQRDLQLFENERSTHLNKLDGINKHRVPIVDLPGDSGAVS
eukprot:TRINITY_DN4007_c0_g1_i1.p1 TRINITY_DN4007_c0_g1~~TRINITY_DN4007_c0_g1_i1.p1  ORF type:complete len:124 (+),score=46.99 TRINITY_DN4007_c0_g1_i1:345-716(+)